MKTFEIPVVVIGADVREHAIASVEDAIRFLETWPVYRRNVFYEAAKRLCHSAHDGLCPADAARNAFAKWAKLEQISGGAVPAWIKPQGAEQPGIAA